uniref:NADH-ubiquinone oxidoreductase subunit B14.7 n=1 Tax=Timspurckia oligopyrenoides TaxID=708627 RepID=A0A7S0ZIZ7_9RHOD|mmetsp:Transcript_652/g.1178  ORF Transcript_652/g.1178 Transcript_652/m.1178 type:complete len:184 (+) Transcript_652:263-814(+)
MSDIEKYFRSLDRKYWYSLPIENKVGLGIASGTLAGFIVAGHKLFVDDLHPRDMTEAGDSKVVQTYLQRAVAARKIPPPVVRSKLITENMALFAAAGGLYALGDSISFILRGKDDFFNAAVGGAFAGSLRGLKFGSVQSAISGALIAGTAMAFVSYGSQEGTGEPYVIPPKVSIFDSETSRTE